jgi:mono/diheme cytochrome c family protein
MRVLKIVVVIFLVAVVALIAYGASRLRHGFSAHKQPSAAETTVARALRHMAIPKQDRDEENPWKDVATADVMKDAREHFADHCADCHANDGGGNTDMGKNLYPPVPDMRLAATQDLSDGELYYIIRNGVPLTGMPAWGDPHFDQDDDSWQLVLFIRHLPRLTPDELKDMQSYNPKGKMETEEEPAAAPAAGKASGKTPEEHHHH